MLDNADDRSTNGNLLGDPRMSAKVGFVGLGRMGTAMAANLAADGHNVCAFVRRPERIGDLQALGIAATTRRPDLFDSDIIITMLPDDAAVRNVLFGQFGLSDLLRPGAVHLSMSTISTAASTAFLLDTSVAGKAMLQPPCSATPTPREPASSPSSWPATRHPANVAGW